MIRILDLARTNSSGNVTALPFFATGEFTTLGLVDDAGSDSRPLQARGFKQGDSYAATMEYRIRLKKGRDGYYVAQCLEVPGAISQGRTKAEALRNAKEALQLVLEVLREDARKGEVARVRVNA